MRDWCSRHPVLEKAEIRKTGGGLHVIPWFAEPVVIKSDSDREKWAAIIQVVQSALPVDPAAPGITATTRALGSVNSNYETKVTRLKKRQPVTTEEVLDLNDKMCDSPFKTVMHILTGLERLTPCPFCTSSESTLTAFDFVGQCYSCGRHKLEDLYDLVLRPQKPVAKGGSRVPRKKNNSLGTTLAERLNKAVRAGRSALSDGARSLPVVKGMTPSFTVTTRSMK